MVIIMRFINSFASTSLTRTSSLSARSLTVMPSASVMVRVISTGAAGDDGRRTARPLATAGDRARPRTLLAERPARTLAERRPLARHAGTRRQPGLARPNGLRRQRSWAAEHAAGCRPRRGRIAGPGRWHAGTRRRRARSCRDTRRGRRRGRRRLDQTGLRDLRPLGRRRRPGGLRCPPGLFDPKAQRGRHESAGRRLRRGGGSSRQRQQARPRPRPRPPPRRAAPRRQARASPRQPLRRARPRRAGGLRASGGRRRDGCRRGDLGRDFR